MKVLILLLSLFCFPNQKILVLNETNAEPIELASVFIYKNGIKVKSGSTNGKGEFYFNTIYDSIVVHSLGFVDKKYVNTNDNGTIIINLKEKTTVLKEVIVSSKKEILLGEHKKKNSETRVIGKEEQFAVLFSDSTKKNARITSLFLNFKKIPYKTDLVFNFYEVDTVQREYTNQKTNKKTALIEIIPDKKNIIETFEYNLKSNLKKGIVEINLDLLNLKLPTSGIFVSVFVKAIYNNEGNDISIASIEQLPFLFKHKTYENNYCVKVPKEKNFWQNYNLVMRHHEDTDEFHPLIPMAFYEPCISIKVEEDSP